MLVIVIRPEYRISVCVKMVEIVEWNPVSQPFHLYHIDLENPEKPSVSLEDPTDGENIRKSPVAPVVP